MIAWKKIFLFLRPKTDYEIIEKAGVKTSFRLQKKVFRIVHLDDRRGCSPEKNKVFYGCQKKRCPKELQIACIRALEIMGKRYENHSSLIATWTKLAKNMPGTGKKIMTSSWSWLPGSHT